MGHPLDWVLAICLLARCTANCAPGQCVEYNGHLYRTLDGTHPDVTSEGCQSSYLSMIDGWELSGYSADARHVGTTYPWGTAVIVHSTTSGQCSATTLYSGSSCGDWRVLVSGATYKPNGCNFRILIAQPTTTTTTTATTSTFTTTTVTATTTTTTTTVTCIEGSGRNAEGGCSPCPAGHMADAGAFSCLPTLAYAVSSLDNPNLTLDADSHGIVRGLVQVTPLLSPLYEAVVLQYSIDAGTNTSNFSMQSRCNQRWTAENSSHLVAVLPYSSLDEDCPLNASVEGGEVHRRGSFAVLLGYTAAGGGPTTTVMRWLFPQTLQFPGLVQAVHSHMLVTEDSGHAEAYVHGPTFEASLALFEGDTLTTVKRVPAYHKHDMVYGAISLVDNLNSHFELRVTSVWLSKSADPSAAAVHNISASVQAVGAMGPNGQGFSAIVQPCMACFLHAMAELALPNGASRRLHINPSASAFTEISVQEAPLDTAPENGGQQPSSAPSAGGTTALTTQGTGDLPLWQVAVVTAAVLFVFIVAAIAVWKFRRRCGRKSSYRKVPKFKEGVSAPSGGDIEGGVDHDKEGVRGPPGGAIEHSPDPLPSPAPLVPVLTPVEHATAAILKRMLSQAVDFSRGFDLRYETTPPHTSIQLVDAWRVEAPYIEEYHARRRRVRREVETVVKAKFPPGSHAPEVTTLLSDLQSSWRLDPACSETWLLHGTACDKVLEILSTGLSEKFSKGLFGRGVYMAEDAAKADQYVVPLKPKGDTTGEAEILKTLFTDFGKPAPKEDTFFLLVCSVALGFPTYTKDAETAMFSPPAVSCLSPGSAVFETTEKRELVKVPGVSPPVRYHSLIAETGGIVRRFREFIVFNGNGILPQYIVAYKRVS